MLSMRGSFNANRRFAATRKGSERTQQNATESGQSLHISNSLA